MGEGQVAVQREGRPHEGRVERALAQLRDQGFAVALGQRHFHIRVALPVLADQLGHDGIERGAFGEAQRQLAHLAARRAPGGLQRRVGALQDVLGAGQEGASGIVQPHAAALAVEQRRANLCFQLADLLRQRRLRHAQLLGGLREVLGFGGGDEIAQMPQFHIDTF